MKKRFAHCTSRALAANIEADGFLKGKRSPLYGIFCKVVWTFDFKSKDDLLKDVRLLNKRTLPGTASKKECAIIFELVNDDIPEITRKWMPSWARYEHEHVFKTDKLYIKIIDIIIL